VHSKTASACAQTMVRLHIIYKQNYWQIKEEFCLVKADNVMKRNVDIGKHKANFVYSRSGFGYGISTNAGKTFRFYNQDGHNIGKFSIEKLAK
jgi:hypothetical protein